MPDFEEILKGCKPKKKKPESAEKSLDLYGILKGKKRTGQDMMDRPGMHDPMEPEDDDVDAEDTAADEAEDASEGEDDSNKKKKKPVKKGFEEVLKYNTSHDPKNGKFTSGNGGASSAAEGTIPMSEKQRQQHLLDLESDNWHTRTMAKMKDRSDESLRFIYRDASEAAKVNPDGKKSGQYLDEANYASMELRRRQDYRKTKKP